MARPVQFVIPAKAGTQRSANSHMDEWIPAFAGMTSYDAPTVSRNAKAID